MQVLIVEDSEIDYLVMARSLSDVFPDWHLRHVTTLEEAIEVSPLADIVILDLTLPDTHVPDARNVLEFIQHCKRPIVIYSGSTDSELIAATAQAGALDFVCKGSPARQLATSLLFARAEFERTTQLKNERWKRISNLCDRIKTARSA